MMTSSVPSSEFDEAFLPTGDRRVAGLVPRDEGLRSALRRRIRTICYRGRGNRQPATSLAGGGIFSTGPAGVGSLAAATGKGDRNFEESADSLCVHLR